MPFLLFLALATSLTSSGMNGQGDVRREASTEATLALGNLEERQIRGGEPHQWKIDVRQGEYIEASVENAGISAP